MYGSNCHQAEQEGVFILHGNRGVYHSDKQPAFQAVYKAIQKVETYFHQSVTRWGHVAKKSKAVFIANTFLSGYQKNSVYFFNSLMGIQIQLMENLM